MIILKPAAAAELDLLENTYTGEKSTKRGPLHLYFKENDPSMQSCAVVAELSGRPCTVLRSSRLVAAAGTKSRQIATIMIGDYLVQKHDMANNN